MDLRILEGVGDVLRMAASIAVLPRLAQHPPAKIEMKEGNEPVTIADREAETIISDGLRKLLPQAHIVGEEACAADPSLAENLSKGLVWIIDPIDGTANFAAGRPAFAMMVALLRDGEAVGSWILDPLGESLAVAERGSGAWIDEHRIQTSTAPVDINRLEGIVSEAFLPIGQQDFVSEIRKAVGSAHQTVRCAGHEYPLVATGARHFALYWRTLVWDHAPGALLLTEAGGSVMHLDGTPYRPSRPGTGLLLAHNAQIASTLLEMAHPPD